MVPEPEPVADVEAAQPDSSGQAFYRAIKNGTIRAAVEQQSAKVGNLLEGEVFESLEETTNESGQRRVRMSRGWVSVTSANGQQLLAASEESAQAEKEAAPDPQPAASPPQIPEKKATAVKLSVQMYKAATEADQAMRAGEAGDLAEVIRLYQEALRMLETALTETPSEKVKSALLNKARAVEKRVAALEKKRSQRPKKAKARPPPVPTKSNVAEDTTPPELPPGEYHVLRGGKRERLCVNTDGLTLEGEGSMFDETWPFDQLGSWWAHGTDITIMLRRDPRGALPAGKSDIEIVVRDSATAAALTEALADAALAHKRGSASAMERSQPEPDAAPAIAEGEPPRSRQPPSRSAARASVASLRGVSSTPPAIPPKNRDGGTPRTKLVQYKVLATATVRIGPEADTDKVGEFKAGTVIDVTEETVNAGGIRVVHSSTPAVGARGGMGGWAKTRTSKGKALLTLVGSEGDPASPTPADSPRKGRRRGSITEVMFGRKPKPDGGGSGSPQRTSIGGKAVRSVLAPVALYLCHL